MPSPAEVVSGRDVVVRRTPGVNGMHLESSSHGVVLSHSLSVADLDNDLASRLARAMAGCDLHDNSLFERLFTEVVLSTVNDPVQAWSAFYRNTLDRITAPDPGAGSIGEFAPIYHRARSLVRGHRVLDVASCFGFLPILLADDGHEVLACDLGAGSMQLLSTVDARIPCVCCRAEALPLRDSGMDTVLMLHLLEHVDAETGSQALLEAVRVARRRVIVAVPYEDEPTAAYGHVRTLDHGELEGLGRLTGQRFEVIDADGGWLVIDR